MTKQELTQLSDVARDVKWIVKEMTEQKKDVAKRLDDHDNRISSVSRRTWMVLGILIATSALLGNGITIR